MPTTKRPGPVATCVAAANTQDSNEVTACFDVAETNGRTIVTGRVSGDFPGSPIELRYAFALDGDEIARLEIS